MKYFIPLALLLGMAAFSFIYEQSELMQLVSIKKDSHFVEWRDRVFRIRNQPTKVSWDVIFQDNCNYNLGDIDQRDWNKLTGLYYNFFNTRAETVMVGWRYNIKEDNIELCAYYHVNKGRDFSKPLLKIKRGEKVRVNIAVNYKTKKYTVSLATKNQTAEHSMAFFHNRKRCGQINFYFGGNRVAPQDISILVQEL